MFLLSQKHFHFPWCWRLEGLKGAPAQTLQAATLQGIRPRREDAGAMTLGEHRAAFVAVRSAVGAIPTAASVCVVHRCL